MLSSAIPIYAPGGDTKTAFRELNRRRAKGASKHERLDRRSSDNGVSGSRHRPQKGMSIGNLAFALDLDDATMDTIDDLYAALEVSAGRESLYPKDDGEAFDHEVGTALCINLDGTFYDATVTSRWSVFERLRYKLEVAVGGGIRISLTQQQLRKVVAPDLRLVPKAVASQIIITKLPVPLLPALLPKRCDLTASLLMHCQSLIFGI